MHNKHRSIQLAEPTHAEKLGWYTRTWALRDGRKWPLKGALPPTTSHPGAGMTNTGKHT